jgi:hypothetical protein
MAVRLPDFTALAGQETGARNVQPGDITPRYYGEDPEAAALARSGAGLEQLGTGLQNFGTGLSRLQSETNLVNAALAQADLHTRLQRTRAEIDAETDPAKIDTLYSQLRTHLDTSGELIGDLGFRNLWKAKHAPDVADVELLAEKRQRTVFSDQFHAGVNQQAAAKAQLYAQSGDPAVREQAIGDLHTLYGSLKESGFSPTQIEAAERKAAQSMILGRTQWLAANNRPQEALQNLMANAQNIEPDDLLRMVHPLRGAVNVQIGDQAFTRASTGGAVGGYRAPPGPPVVGATPAEQQTLNEIRYRESSGDYAQVHPDSGAAGAYQFLGQTWKETTQQSGIGKEYPTADKAPKEVQDANALWLLRNKGTQPWDASGPYPSSGGDQLEADFAKRSGAFGTPAEAGRNLTAVTAPGGASFQVNQKAAPQIQGFVNELEGMGYKIDPANSGGYNNRNKVGVNTHEKSEHAYGGAIDINSDRNKQDTRLITDLPSNIEAVAAKWGLKWGGTFEGTKDAMHFEVARLLPGGQPATQVAAQAPLEANVMAMGLEPAPDTPEARYSRTLDNINADPVLKDNPIAYERAIHKAEAAYRAENIRDASLDRARKQASDRAADSYVQRMMADQMAGIVEAIGQDPNLNKADRENLWALAEKHVKSDVAGTVKTMGPGIYDVLRRTTLPDDDPNRLSEPRQILALGLPGPNGEPPWLTLQGVDRVQREMRETRIGPDAHAVVDMKNKQLAYAKHKLSFEEDYGFFKIRDPKGEDTFNSAFAPAFYNAYENGIKAGKTPYQLLSRDSPDYIVDKLIGAYRRSDAEYAQDRINAGAEQPTGGPRTLQQITADVKAGKITAEAGKAEAVRLGLVAPDQPSGAPTPAPALPIIPPAGAAAIPPPAGVRPAPPIR